VNRNQKVVFAIAAGALSGILPLHMVRADLTSNGAVGLPINPTAELPAPNSVRVQADYIDLGSTTATTGGVTGTVDFKVIGAHVAGRIGSLPLELNAGIERTKAAGVVTTGGGVFTGSASQSGLAFGAKYRFLGGRNPLAPQVALGAGYSKANLRNTYVYLVASKNFGDVTLGRVPITAHLGVRYDRIDIKPGDFDNAGFQALSNYVSAYGGVEVPVTRAGEFALVGELQSKRTAVGKTAYSAAVRYRPRNTSVSGTLGIQRQGFTGDNGLFAQIGYNFG
jgi:hypothetical protein